MTKLAGTLSTLPMPALRSLLTTLIAHLEVDIATKAVAIDIAMPDWTDKNACAWKTSPFKDLSTRHR